MRLILINILLLLYSLSLQSQTYDTLTICNGDSIFIYNNWESQTGVYTDGFNYTTLVVNPTPNLTGTFILNGNATQPSPNTYDLTQAVGNQSGSAWNSVTLNLTQPFSFDVDMFFGYNNNGADGIAFLLQQVNTSVGSSGGGLGYQGISPSFCIEFDTWRNSNNSDPYYDHIAVQKNGNLNHSGNNNLQSPVGFPPNNLNIENGQWHNVIFTWDPSMFNFKVFFNGIVVVNYYADIVSDIFSNNPNVYWGFTAATGGANNLQRFRVNSLGIQLSDFTICSEDTVQIDPQINSSLFTYLWSPNYNIIDNTVPIPYIFPDSTINYFFQVTNSYGCSYIDSLTVHVNQQSSTMTDVAVCSSYVWSVDGNTYQAPGVYSSLSTNSDGCDHIDSLILTLASGGCIDPLACNYDSLAICDDGSCLYNTATPLIISTCDGLNEGGIGVSISPFIPNNNYSFTVDNSSFFNYDDTISNLSAGFYNFEFFINNISCGVQNVEVTNYSPLNYTINNIDETCSGSSDGVAYINTQGVNAPNGTVSNLSYCSSNPNTNFITTPQTIIEEVQLYGDNFNIINNTQLSADFYEDYTNSFFADISPNQSYTVNVTLANMGFSAYDPEAVNIYIDFNIDGDFSDPGEDLGVILIPFATWTTNTIYPFSFTVPNNSVSGPTRMRVVCISNAGGAPINMGPCESPTGFGTPWFGATEDYSLVINNSVSSSYLWSNGDSSDSIYSLSSGTYFVSILDQNGCITNDSVFIDTNYSPTVYTSQDQSICHSGSANQLTASSNVSGNYSWYPPNSFVDPNVQNPVFSSNLISTTTFVVTLLDSNGCTALDSVTVNVNPIPSVTISTLPSSACQNDTIQLIASSSIPLNLYRFQYNSGNGWQNIITTNNGGWGNINPQIFNNIITTTQFRVKVREWWGCTVSPWSPVISVPINAVNTPFISHN